MRLASNFPASSSTSRCDTPRASYKNTLKEPCMTTAQPKARRRFPGLDPVALQHPYDRAALGALQRVPGFDIVIRTFIELFPERVAYIQNVAQTVRVSTQQCPQLYAQLQEACAI